MIQAHALTLWQAWHVWRVAEVPSDATLWGLQILWWARLGKILQFIAGLTIVADILGPTRLRAFGGSLHEKITRHTLGEYVSNAWWYYVEMFRYAFLTQKNSPEEAEAWAESSRYKAKIINAIISLAFTALIVHLWGPEDLFGIFWTVLIVFGGMFLWVGPVLTFSLVLSGAAVGLVLDLAIIEPAAWILERESLDKGVKVFALLCFVIGFHFDLLAS